MSLRRCSVRERVRPRPRGVSGANATSYPLMRAYGDDPDSEDDRDDDNRESELTLLPNVEERKGSV